MYQFSWEQVKICSQSVSQKVRTGTNFEQWLTAKEDILECVQKVLEQQQRHDAIVRFEKQGVTTARYYQVVAIQLLLLFIISIAA